MEYDKKFLILTTILMVAFIILSTVLHHLYPEILQVPDVRGPFLIENTLLDLILMDIGSIFITLLVV